MIPNSRRIALPWLVLSSNALRFLASSALAAGVLVLSPAAVGVGTPNPALDVTFSPTGAIAVTQPDGTPVGATAGSPTVIPAGYYTLLMSGPGGCTQLPLFELKGPGEDLFENMTEGEVDYTSDNVFLQPSATYTWKSYASPSVVHTFATSSTVLGAPPTPTSSVSSGTVSSQDIVGSNATTTGSLTITGTVSPAGRLTLSFKGRSIDKLAPGPYTIIVTDRSSTDGLAVEMGKGRPLTVTGGRFEGKKSRALVLTAGRWTFTSGAAGKYAVTVA